MSYLQKDKIFFERDGEGKLLPVDVVLEMYDNKTMIKILPMNRGEFAEISSKIKDFDANSNIDVDIVIKHCVEPKFTEEDREPLQTSGKVNLLNAIVTAIISASTGIEQKTLLEEGKKKIINNELEQLEKK